MAARVTFLLLAAMLAGCTGDGPDADPGSPAPDATTGVIRGVVLDEALRPLAGIRVELTGRPDQHVETGDDGMFRFGGLPPGAYGVKASHPLYSSATQVVDVVAGVHEPPAVRLQVIRVVDATPYMRTARETGLITCSANAAGSKSEECGEGVGVPGQGRVGGNPDNRAQIDFYVDGPAAKTIIVEQVWEPGTEAGSEEAGQFDTRLATDWSCEPECRGNVLDAASGSSPLYLRAEGDRLERIEPSAETRFSTFTWAGGDSGVLVDQEFELYISTFYHLPAPEGWSFLEGDPDPFAG